MKFIYTVFAYLIIMIVSGCTNNSGGTNNSKSANTEVEKTINSTYTFRDNSVALEITINGNSWHGKTVIVTGFGSDYDNKNAQYDNGILKGDDLFESSGIVKVGYIRENSLTTSIGGKSVILRK